jgi:uncharacterized protein (UPF0248 family)
MIPIHSLLDRVRWDPEFGRAEFTVGYYDRVRRRVILVPLARIQIDPGNHSSFTAIEADGSMHDVPLHRVREVYRNGDLIWRRPPPRRETKSR